MNTVVKGFLVFGSLILIIALFCVWPAFFWAPQARVGVPIPVITLPGEVLAGNIFGVSGPLGGFDLTNTITSVLLVDVILIIMALVAGFAYSQVAPDRFVPRGFTNFIELIAEFLYNQGRGLLGNFTRTVFPLAATVFLFLLVGNWIKLIPGVESVGLIACAEYKPTDPKAKAGQPGFDIWGQDDNVPGIFLKVNDLNLKGRAGDKANEDETHACEEKYPQFTPPIVEAKKARGEGEKTEGGEKKGTPSATQRATQRAATPQPTRSAFSIGSGDTPVNFAVNASESVAKPAAAEGANPNLFVVVPYFRGLATDLNVALALAIIVFFAVQAWGIMALGPAYFFKFINIPALGKLDKKPLGLIDFIVGLVEIISELSRLVSLSFRLFGNITAGGILLIVMTFLVGGGVPMVFYFLELFVGLIQAYVFTTLTFIYASQAVTHHGDDDHHGEEHHADSAHGHEAAKTTAH